MFMGTWLHASAVGYIPRSRSKGQRWTHWKVEVVRARYNDCALLSVDIYFTEARKLKGGGWSSRKGVQIEHRVSLGNLNDRETRERLVTNDDTFESGKNKPKVIAELKEIVDEIEKYATARSDTGQAIETSWLNLLVECACLR